MLNASRTRMEADALGALEVPADAYWGIHTERARRNFQVSGRPVAPALIRALALVKQAACLTNRGLGCLDPARAQALLGACEAVAGGALADQFPLDALQGGAGTSTNMNVNEVLANLALERLGRPKGDYAGMHPPRPCGWRPWGAWASWARRWRACRACCSARRPSSGASSRWAAPSWWRPCP